MPTLVDILNDKDRPDDTTIVIEGVETTLGELRGGYSRQADYTRKTTETARERAELRQERQEFEVAKLDAEAKLTELAQSILTKNPSATPDEFTEALERDPVAKRLAKQLDELNNGMKELQKQTKEQADRAKSFEMERIADQHRSTLRRLKEEDKDLDETELVGFAKETWTPRLDVAYKALKFDTAIAKARKEAKAEGVREGIEKAKIDLAQPLIVPRRMVPKAEDNTPTTFQEALNAAGNDPEIVGPLMGGIVT